MKKFKQLTAVSAVVGITLLGFALRLYRIHYPLADWHSFRQADTASVSREYVKHGIDLLHPKYHDLSNIQSGFDNPQGFRMVEFPLINALGAVGISVFGFIPEFIVLRFMSVLFSTGSIVLIYHLTKILFSKKSAELAAFFFAVLPYSVYYGRVILPEVPLLFFLLLSLVSFTHWITTKSLKWYLVSWLSLTIALLLKPFAAFYAPLYIVIIVMKGGKNRLLDPLLVCYAFAAAPMLWWRQWITNFPTGVPVSAWLFNSNGIRWEPAWFRWILWERLTKLITGGLSLILFPLAVFSIKKQGWIYILALWVGVGAYASIIATGNVQHDYYQVLYIPAICITLARGVEIIYSLLLKKFSRRVSLGLCVVLIGFGLAFSTKQVGGYFNVNHWEYIKAGKRADELLPKNAQVIAPAFGDTVFLYQTNRTGWPIGFQIEDKIAKGAQYYIGTSYDDETNMLLKNYAVIEQTPEYAIIDLTRPLP